MLEDGSGSMVARAWLSEYAEKTIDIQYFIFSTDNVGLIACDYLIRAADRGVKVRILVDDIMVDADLEDILMMNSHENINIKVYNPGVNLGKSIVGKLKKFATDFRNLSDVNILMPLKEVVQRPDSDLMLLHIFKKDDDELGENVLVARELGKYFGIDNFDYSFLEGSNKLMAIEEFATGYSADLLTLVAQERTFFQEVFHRSLTKRLLIHTKIPILVLHRVEVLCESD